MFKNEWLLWLKRSFRRLQDGKQGKMRRPRPRFRPLVENLEDRTLMSVTVLSTAAVTSGPPLATANGQSETLPVHSTSDNGRFTVYSSDSINLIANQNQPPNEINIFLHDNQTGTTTLISHAASDPATAADGTSFNAAISGDGSTVAFYSTSTDMIAGQTIPAGSVELYAFNTGTGAITLVSHAYGASTTGSNGQNPALPPSPSTHWENTLGYSAGSAALGQDINGLAVPSLSANGQYIAYIDDATDLGGADTGLDAYSGLVNTNVFLYDAAANTNTLVSHAASLTTTANGTQDGGGAYATTVAISADGSTIAFTDPGVDLVAGQNTDGVSDQLYVWSRTGTNGLSAGQTVLASHDASDALTGATIPNNFNFFFGWSADTPPSLSADGSEVAYYHAGTDQVAGQAGTPGVLNVFRYNVASNTNDLVTHVYGTTATDLATAGNNPQNQVAAPGQGAVEATGPQISADGRYIAYANNSNNLLATTFSGTVDNVYLYDAATQLNTLVSNNGDGTGLTPDAGGGTAPSMSADGMYVTFADLAIPASGPLTAAAGTVNVRLFTRGSTSQPVVIGESFDSTPLPPLTGTGADAAATLEFYSSAFQPTIISADGSTIVWSGPALATDMVPSITDANLDLDVFQATNPNSGGTTPQPPTGITLSNNTTTAFLPVGTTVGTFTDTDTNAGQTETYTISGPDSSLFTIDDSGNLLTSSIFTNSATQTFHITVTATDSPAGLTSSAQDFTITVNPVAPSNITLSSRTTSTYQPIGTLIGSFADTDPNAGQTETFLLSGTDSNLFTIDNSGNLLTNSVFSNTTPQTYIITVTATDSPAGLTSSTQDFTITVNPESPTAITLSNSTTTTYQPTGTLVGTLMTTDPNPNQTFIYTLQPTDAPFTITGDTLTTNSVLTTAQQYTIQVTTTDSADLTFTQSLTITVNPTTAVPTNITLSNTTVTTEQPIGTLVGTLNVTDPNAGQTDTFALTNDSSSLFTVDNLGNIVTSSVFTNTTPQTFNIFVTATDSPAGLTSSVQEFTITVNPAAPTGITLSNSTVTTYQPTGTLIGTLATTDPNPNQTFTYALQTPDSPFTITGDTLTTNSVLTTAQQYTIAVQTTDANSQTYLQTFTITVNPTTAAPTNITLSNTTVTTEQPIGTIVGTLSATDPNVGQTDTFTINPGTNSNLFTIDNVGNIVTNSVFTNTTPVTYILNVTAADSPAGLSSTQEFTITVNPAAPTGITLSNSTVTTYQPTGTLIGTLATTDSNPNQNFTYVLMTTGTPFTLTGDTLTTNSVLTSAQQYTIQIQTTDADNQSVLQNFTITVNPTTVAPTNITLSNSTTSAYQPAGAFVGTLSATDPNVGQTITYTLGGTDSNLFTIDNAGNLVTSSVFTNTTPQTYSITVTAADSPAGVSSAPQAFTITVNPEGPTAITLSNSTTTTYQPAGTLIGTLTTTDPNPNQTFTYMLVTPDAPFTIVGASLETNSILTIAQQYSIQVTTTDSANLTFTQTLTITVNPTTAVPTNITLSNTSVTTEQPIGSLVGTLSATDPNAGQTITYTLGGADSNLFTIDNAGNIVTSSVFTNTTPQTYNITVTATDSPAGLTSLQQAFTITVDPAAPTGITLSNSTTTTYQPAGTLVGTLATTDPNPNQTFTYTLMTTGTPFTLTGDTITTNSVIMTAQQYTLSIETTDADNQSITQSVTITVNPTTAPPTNITLSNSTVPSYQPVGTLIGTLSATDPNVGQTVTYSLNGPGADQFTVDNNGNLLTNTVFSTTVPVTYTITVYATDSLNLTSSQTVTITVNPSTLAPTSIALSNDTVSAARPSGTVVGTLSTVDPNVNQTFTYSLLTTGTPFTIVGDSLETNSVIQTTTVQEFSIEVQTTDSLNLSFTQTFTITVNPSTATPTAITLSSTSVTAYRPIGSVVGVVNSTDPNVGQTVAYTLSGPDASDFSIDAAGNVTTASVLTTQQTYSVIVTATDSLNLSSSQTFTITANPSTAAPTNITLSNNAATAYRPIGTLIGTLSSSDINVGQTVSYSLTGANASLFTIDNAGNLKTNSVLTPQSYAITVVATDSLNLSSTQDFTILVTAPVAASVSLSADESATVGHAFGNPLVATVLDAAGYPVPNVTVTFTLPSSGASGSLISLTGTTDANGQVSKILTANNIAGSFTVLVSVNNGSDPSALFHLTNLADAPASVTLTGDNQTATTGTAYANPLTATVLDAHGNPVPNITVTFTLPTSGAGGTLTSLTGVTNANGQVSETLTANNTLGVFTVGVAVTGGTNPTGHFLNLDNISSVPASITLTGNNQTATVAHAYASGLVVTVLDATGHPVANKTVTFTRPTTGASGTLSATTAVTNASGQVCVHFTANTIAGLVTIGVSVAGGSNPTGTFNLTNTADVPASVLVTGGGKIATVTTAFAAPLVATVVDRYGNPVSGQVVTFTLPSSGSAGGTLSDGVTGVSDTNGKVTKTLTANTKAGTYSIHVAVTGGSNPANTIASLTNTAGAAVSMSMVFVKPPAIFYAGNKLPNIVIQLLDQYGNNAAPPKPGTTVTISLPTGKKFRSGMTATTIFNASGAATFSGLFIDLAGSETLQMNSAGMTANNSLSFNVMAKATNAARGLN